MSRLSFVLALTLATTATAGVAFAQPADTAVKMSVRGVDFADSSQVRAFYNHVAVAAQTACNSEARTPDALKEDRDCRAQFIESAVNQVNAPLLTAMNNQESRQFGGYRQAGVR